MMNNNMLEAQEGSATLEDLDSGTMMRFIEWLYRGYYHAAPCGVKRSLEDSTTEEPRKRPGASSGIILGAKDTASNLFSLLGSTTPVLASPATSQAVRFGNPRKNSTSNSIIKSPSRVAKEHFLQREYRVRQIFKSLTQPERPAPLNGSEEDFSAVFLCHAHIYVFADKWDIQPLKILALEELHATLAAFPLDEDRVNDILALLSYVYDKAPEQADKMEDLRTLMKQYAESELETLLKCKGLAKCLMEDHGGFVEALLSILRERLP